MVLPSPVVRVDDLRRGWSRQFEGLVRELVAWHPDEVVVVLGEAEAEAAGGRWVVGYLAYEAAPAFDPAMVVCAPEAGVPLAWFGVFDEAVEAPSLDGVGGAVSPVGTIERLGGSQWYQESVEAIRARIALGDVYQVNLTDRFTCAAPPDPADLYAAMARAQRGRFNALIHHGGTVVMSASPELFIHWDGDVLSSSPMKGTRARGLDDVADRAVVDELSVSEKDRAENVMIVDLIRNDMSRVAVTGTVEVPDLFAIERYETVWQMTSTVRCQTRPGTSLGDVMGAMFPCGSVTGAPKVAAMGIIADLEARPRGVYCGAVGVLAPEGHGPRAVFSVAIRTAVADIPSGRAIYGAGGGITFDSDPVDEDAEAEAKTAVLRRPRPDFALFETMRCEGDRILRRDLHVERLRSSAHYFGFPWSRVAVDNALDEAVNAAAGEERRVRLEWSRSGHAAVTVVPITVGHAGPVRLVVSDAGALTSTDPFSRHKTTWRAHYDAARASAGDDIDDVVMVNERGEAAETTIASLLFRRPGATRWQTPPLASGGLDGVGRRALLESGQIDEGVVAAAELGQCELAVVSSLRGVRPAVLVERSADPSDSVDQRQRQPMRTDVVDAQDRGSAQRSDTPGADGRDVPFLEIGRTTEGGHESLA